VTGRVFHVGDPIPGTVTRADLAATLGTSTKTIDRYRRLKHHPAICPLDGPGAVRFSGRALKDWLEGRQVVPTTTGRRFFASARRTA
jgi:predicted DNA-binding transcriptional regulator AlpA